MPRRSLGLSHVYHVDLTARVRFHARRFAFHRLPKKCAPVQACGQGIGQVCWLSQEKTEGGMKLKGSVIVVTGGASGLGAATVERLVEAGASVGIFDLNASEGVPLAERLGDNARFVRVDVTDNETVGAGLSEITNTFGAIHGLVTCAGVASAAKTLGRDGPHDLGLFEKVQDINLKGSFNIARLAAQAMALNPGNKDGERGAIVFTSSVAAFDGQKGQVAYAASKGGVAAMTLPMARDLASQGIRVNAIAPGLFLTPLLQGLPDAAQKALADQPLFPRRLGSPTEFAELVCFLLENLYMNAEVVRLDAGIRLP